MNKCLLLYIKMMQLDLLFVKYSVYIYIFAIEFQDALSQWIYL